MKTYRVLVLAGGVHVWAQLIAQNSDAARRLFEAQYGRSNVVSTPVVVA